MFLEEVYNVDSKVITIDNDQFMQTNIFLSKSINEKPVEYIERYYKEKSNFLVMFNPSNIPVFEDRVLVYAEQIRFAKDNGYSIKFKKDKRHPDLYVCHLDLIEEVEVNC
jgi:hypothetical protein